MTAGALAPQSVQRAKLDLFDANGPCCHSQNSSGGLDQVIS